MQPELTLRFAHQNNSDYLTCPVARLQQDSQGTWLLDETFLPPLLTLQGSRWLVTQLEQLLTQLRARLCRLMAMRRESNERMADFAVADVSLFWLLNALNSAEPVLGQFQRNLQSPPERLYPELSPCGEPADLFPGTSGERHTGLASRATQCGISTAV
jgi:type VI secretion system protein ImpJ